LYELFGEIWEKNTLVRGIPPSDLFFLLALGSSWAYMLVDLPDRGSELSLLWEAHGRAKLSGLFYLARNRQGDQKLRPQLSEGEGRRLLVFALPPESVIVGY
jgi:hypothetical protein